ncbi:unnamed protein product [Lactuca saligna]|uniref:Uncharacterized protein n=1 Tax=Lactuca saligna TaxID=75948 RepID=A0AA36A1E5_LACSI|nr:unnamed protein product [Lactuca saligna]
MDGDDPSDPNPGEAIFPGKNPSRYQSLLHYILCWTTIRSFAHWSCMVLGGSDSVMVDLEISCTPTTIRHHCISRLLILTSYLFTSSVGIENQNAQI